MARGALLNQIPDLQIEWATHHPNLSVRDFLMNKKSMTERQYRHIISNSPLITWVARREEIHNTRVAEQIKTFIDESIQTQTQFMTAAQIGVQRILEQITDDSSPPKPAGLASLMSALERAQNVMMTAAGGSSFNALKTLSKEREPNLNHKPKTIEVPSSPDGKELQYEDLIEFIEYRREQKTLSHSLSQKGD